MHLQKQAGGRRQVALQLTRVRLDHTDSMFWQTLGFAALLVQDATAQRGGNSLGSSDFLRFGCSQLVVERTDPLVNPGMAPSPHMHQVVGGNSFNITVGNSYVDAVDGRD